MFDLFGRAQKINEAWQELEDRIIDLCQQAGKELTEHYARSYDIKDEALLILWEKELREGEL